MFYNNGFILNFQLSFVKLKELGSVEGRDLFVRMWQKPLSKEEVEFEERCKEKRELFRYGSLGNPGMLSSK